MLCFAYLDLGKLFSWEPDCLWAVKYYEWPGRDCRIWRDRWPDQSQGWCSWSSVHQTSQGFSPSPGPHSSPLSQQLKTDSRSLSQAESNRFWARPGTPPVYHVACEPGEVSITDIVDSPVQCCRHNHSAKISKFIYIPYCFIEFYTIHWASKLADSRYWYEATILASPGVISCESRASFTFSLMRVGQFDHISTSVGRQLTNIIVFDE